MPEIRCINELFEGLLGRVCRYAVYTYYVTFNDSSSDIHIQVVKVAITDIDDNPNVEF